MAADTERDQATIALAKAELAKLADGFGSEDPVWQKAEREAWQRELAQAVARISRRAF